jgi:hypothetical protein
MDTAWEEMLHQALISSEPGMITVFLYSLRDQVKTKMQRSHAKSRETLFRADKGFSPKTSPKTRQALTNILK